MYPGELEPGLHRRKNSTDGESSDQSTDPKDQEKTDTRSLRIYLHDYQEHILNISSSSHGISRLVVAVSSIYKQLLRRKFVLLNERNCTTTKNWDGSPALIEVAQGSIKEVVGNCFTLLLL